ncbi:MAG: hypothetical protein IJ129_06920, partial [Ruminococcus sp.]|nr:hypothetical protein [Ruminococcus sp.]
MLVTPSLCKYLFPTLLRFFHAGHPNFVQISISNFAETFSRIILQWSAPEAKESSGRGEPERGKLRGKSPRGGRLLPGGILVLLGFPLSEESA